MSHSTFQPFDRRIRPTGFTLIELMVVLVIVFVFTSLLLPAIQQAREAARRSQCKNNLFQIGLALNNYQMAHDVLPPGTQNATGPIRSVEQGGYHMGWLSQILPFLEQQNAYDRIDFTKSVYDPINSPVRTHLIRTFVCPATMGGTGTTSYNGVHNDIAAPIDVDQNGVLFLNSSIDAEQIRDGQSNTIFVMENTGNWAIAMGWMAGTRSSLCNAVVAQPIDDAATNGDSSVDAHQPIYTLHTNTVHISDANELRREIAVLQPGTNAVAEFVWGPSSPHFGLFHVALGDGSVRAISTNIDARILRQLAHRSDGEMLDDF